MSDTSEYLIRKHADNEIAVASLIADNQYDMANMAAKKANEPSLDSEAAAVQDEIATFRKRIDALPSGPNLESQVKAILAELKEYETIYKAKLAKTMKNLSDKAFMQTSAFQETFRQADEPFYLPPISK